MNTYKYVGPVVIFGKVVQENWKGVTTAISEKKAKSNLAYRWKKENNMLPQAASVALPGPLEVI